LVTEGTLVIEPKGIDSFQMPNRLKIIIASNSEWVVPATKDERRFFVLDVPSTRKGDMIYFKKLAAAIEGDELGAFIDHLLGLDLSDFDHRNPPHTAALNKQKLIGGDSIQKYWFDCLYRATIIGCEIGDGSAWPKTVDCADLRNAFLEHAHDHGDRHPPGEEHFARALRQLCPSDSLTRVRPWKENAEKKRPRYYKLGDLDAHRDAFLEAMGIADYDWPAEIEE
jgi:hypothetical protein